MGQPTKLSSHVESFVWMRLRSSDHKIFTLSEVRCIMWDPISSGHLPSIQLVYTHDTVAAVRSSTVKYHNWFR